MSHALISLGGSDSLVGLSIPLTDRKLLLPNVAVAELVPYRRPTAMAGQPRWFLGELPWRDQRLPLISFEAATGAELEWGDTPRIVVLNAIGGRPLLSFIALLVQGIPRSLRVLPDIPSADVPLGPMELAAVTVDDEILRIPDLEALEQLVADLKLGWS